MEREHDTPPAVVAVGRLLQFFVYAPIGAGAKLIDDAPGAVARARQELSNARFIGRLAVAQGEARLRERLATATSDDTGDDSGHDDTDDAPAPADDVTSSAVTSDDVTPADETVGTAIDDVAVADADDDGDGPSVPAADDLAIPDYDHLPAIDVLGQLESLAPDELDLIERYERDHRRRRTVLGKIDQLRDA